MSRVARGVRLELEGHTEVEVRDTVAKFGEGTYTFSEEVASTEISRDADVAVSSLDSGDSFAGPRGRGEVVGEHQTCIGVELGHELVVEGTASTEDGIGRAVLRYTVICAAGCVADIAPDGDRAVVAVDEVVDDTVVKAHGEGWDGQVRVDGADTDTSVDSCRALVEDFLSISEADTTYEGKCSEEYFLDHSHYDYEIKKWRDGAGDDP